MKKFTILTLLSAMISLTTQAQTVVSSATAKNSRTYLEPKQLNIAKSIQLKFQDDYPGAVNESWLRTDDGFLVSFFSDDMQFRVTLNSMGKITSEIRYYPEKYLASEIRKMIKESYPCVTVFLVREIRINSTKTFLVTIDTGVEWITVRIVDNKMDVLESFIKG